MLPSFQLVLLLLLSIVSLFLLSVATALAPLSSLNSQLSKPFTTALPAASFFEDEEVFFSDDDEDIDSIFNGPPPSIVVIGATGGTGLRALQGLLDVGWEPSRIRLLTRNPDAPLCQALRDKLGFKIFEVDFDDKSDENSNRLRMALQGCSGCYVHALGSDTRKVKKGVAGDRARSLAFDIASQCYGNNKFHVVLNSAAGEPNHGVNRIQEMHNIERVCNEWKNIRLTSLRANLFMEEFWKTYIRPSVCNKGKFSFSVPSDRSIHLTSVRDMGKLAGTVLLRDIILKNNDKDDSSSSSSSRVMNVAGDVLTAEEIAAVFAKAQDSPCRHSSGRASAWFCRLFFRDLYQIIRFYRRTTETTDIPKLQQEFPGLLTDFKSFLDETDWGNPDLSYANFTDVDRLLSKSPRP